MELQLLALRKPTISGNKVYVLLLTGISMSSTLRHSMSRGSPRPPELMVSLEMRITGEPTTPIDRRNSTITLASILFLTRPRLGMRFWGKVEF